jgi:hypothetical protein
MAQITKRVTFFPGCRIMNGGKSINVTESEKNTLITTVKLIPNPANSQVDITAESGIKQIEFITL